MSGITPLIILLFAMLIFAFLQVTPGIFAIFYHFASGKYSKRKSDDLALSFIIGSEIFNGLMWLLIYAITFTLFYNFSMSNILIFTLAGIFFALTIVCYCFYFKKSTRSSETFTPRRIVRGIIARSRTASSRTDATLLGFFAGIPEIIFTLPLIFISCIILQTFTVAPRVIVITIAIILTVLPFFVIRRIFRSGYNLADVMRFRIRIKPYIRYTLSLSFLIVAILTIILGAYYG